MLSVIGINDKQYPRRLSNLMALFNDEPELQRWGGPDFRFPFDRTSFVSDAMFENRINVWLVDEDHSLMAFGQCYERIGRCHLARLVVAPAHRGQRLIEALIDELVSAARQHASMSFDFSEISLFVLNTNQSARRVYKRLGFECRDYLGELGTESDWSDVLYMCKQLT